MGHDKLGKGVTFEMGAITGGLLANGAPGEAFTDVSASLGDVRQLVPEQVDEEEEEDEEEEPNSQQTVAGGSGDGGAGGGGGDGKDAIQPCS